MFCSAPQDIHAIVRAPADVLYPGAGASVLAPLVGEGSFMLAEGDTHFASRRTILPAFHYNRVQGHAKMIEDITMGEFAAWPQNRAFPIHPRLRALSLRVILRTIFSGQLDLVERLHQRLLAMLAITSSLALQEVRLRSLPMWRGLWRRFLAERTIVNGILDQLIWREAHAHALDSGLLDMLLEGSATSKLDTKQIREDLLSIIVAGHETTAAELAWAFQLLAHHRDVADRLVADHNAGDGRYLTATVQEVLRHRPAFMFAIPRVVQRPFELAGHVYHPPEQLVGCIHLMQHDPELYDDPGRFRPERFLESSPADVWLPWGGGRKHCPGRHLAMLEMQVVLGTVLESFDVLPAAPRVETARWRSVIVTPGRGSRVVLRPRRTQT